MHSYARSAERKGRALVERKVRGGENLSEIKLKPCPFCGGKAIVDSEPVPLYLRTEQNLDGEYAPVA